MQRERGIGSGTAGSRQWLGADRQPIAAQDAVSDPACSLIAEEPRGIFGVVGMDCPLVAAPSPCTGNSAADPLAGRETRRCATCSGSLRSLSVQGPP